MRQKKKERLNFKIWVFKNIERNDTIKKVHAITNFQHWKFEINLMTRNNKILSMVYISFCTKKKKFVYALYLT